MAFTATTVWQVQTGGDDTNNGGGFDTGVAGFPTDGAATVATGSSPVFTSASYTFVAGDVGALVYIKSGTNWTPGWYQIVSVSVGAATLSAAAGAAVLATLQASTVNGCATTASPTAATWGIDYSQQAAAQITFTDLVIDGTTSTKFTSAAHPVGKNFVGNSISITSGTGFTIQRVAIVSTSGTTATCDKSLGTLSSTAGNGRLGGALASPGQAGAVKIAGNDIFIKAGTYTLAGSSANTSGGPVTDSTGGTGQTNVSRWTGYSVIPCIGNSDTKPLISAGAVTAVTLFSATGNHIAFENLSVDGNNGATTTGISLGNSYTRAVHCKAANCKTVGITVGDSFNEAVAYACEVTGCSTGANAFYVGNTARAIGCESHGNTNHGFGLGATANVISCISYANTGASTDGFSTGTVGYFAINCVAYNNGRTGFDCTGNAGFGTLFLNCIAEGNASEGWRTAGVVEGVYLLYCAGYNNTGGNYNTARILNVAGFQAGSGSFFTSAGAGDFSLNNTASAGALCRAAGFPGLMPAGTTTGYADIGAAQHQDAGGGGLAACPLGGFIR